MKRSTPGPKMGKQNKKKTKQTKTKKILNPRKLPSHKVILLGKKVWENGFGKHIADGVFTGVFWLRGNEPRRDSQPGGNGGWWDTEEIQGHGTETRRLAVTGWNARKGKTVFISNFLDVQAANTASANNSVECWQIKCQMLLETGQEINLAEHCEVSGTTLFCWQLKVTSANGSAKLSIYPSLFQWLFRFLRLSLLTVFLLFQVHKCGGGHS